MQARGGDVIRPLSGRLALFFLLVLGGVGADQITKFAIFAWLGGAGESKEIIGGILSLTYSRNTGTVFGLFPGSNGIFIALTAVAIVVVMVYFLKSAVSAGPMMTAAAALIIAGAVGNLVDRLLFQYVRDFIDFHVWPVFNVADVLICVGAAGLVYSSLISDKDKVHVRDSQCRPPSKGGPGGISPNPPQSPFEKGGSIEPPQSPFTKGGST